MYKKWIPVVLVIAGLAAAFFYYQRAEEKEKERKGIEAQRADSKKLLDATDTINGKIDSILGRMQMLMTKNETAPKMALLYPKAEFMKVLANETVIFINNIKLQLLVANESGDESIDKASVRKIIFNYKAGARLFDTLNKFVENFLRIDPQIDKEFHDNMFIIKELDRHNSRTWVASTFEGQTVLGAILMLQMMEAQVREDELRGISFQMSRAAMDDIKYDDK